MASNEELYEFLLSLGTDEVAHTGHDFLTHLKSVQGVLEAAGADTEMSQAGLFHSIYGTQTFQDFSLPLAERAQVQGLIGERAEFTAFCNCVMDRETFDAAVASALADGGESFEISDREGSPPIPLSRAQLTDLGAGACVRLAGAGGAVVAGVGLPANGVPADGGAGRPGSDGGLRRSLRPRGVFDPFLRLRWVVSQLGGGLGRSGSPRRWARQSLT